MAKPSEMASAADRFKQVQTLVEIGVPIRTACKRFALGKSTYYRMVAEFSNEKALAATDQGKPNAASDIGTQSDDSTCRPAAEGRGKLKEPA